MKRFKMLGAVLSFALIFAIIIVPCAVFFANAQTVDNSNITSAQDPTVPTDTLVVTKEYVEDLNLTNKQSEDTTNKAKAFDEAKKASAKTVEATVAAIEDAKKKPAASAKATSSNTTSSKNTSSSVSVSTNVVKPSSGKYLLAIDNPDPSYVSYSVSLSAYDRDILERLVMGEAGAEGYIGACLVAQAIRDTYVQDGFTSIETLRTSMGYYGSLSRTPNQDVLDAVSFIFDQGGAAVQHNVMFFYAPSLCTSGWHESQEFVVAYNSHRFFDRW